MTDTTTTRTICTDCGTDTGEFTYERDVCDVCVRMIIGLGPF